VFKENQITAIVKDSSAARNGLLIDHHMVEVNGQNVIGLKVTVNTAVSQQKIAILYDYILTNI